MKNSIWPILVVLVVAGVAGIAWYLHLQREPAMQQLPGPVPAQQAPPPAPAAAATPRYPMVEPPAAPQVPAKPLPALDDSDNEIDNALAELFGRQSLEQFFELQGLVRHVVATIDNLPRDKVSAGLRAFRPVPGRFAVSGSEGDRSIDPGNYARYVPYVRFAQALDARRLVAVYAHFYPLFQQAYVELGYPDGYFNDRLVEVIDHLLATPAVTGPVRLVQPNVLYRYADPELESLSAGQKMLIRMGPDNATAVKTKLREIRTELAARAPRR
ncbi:MAG: DUF3014 domain-containing protein [Nevskia sp.]|nr:DUF3014 domain-containing protein [Nevskia sp.]